MQVCAFHKKKDFCGSFESTASVPFRSHSLFACVCVHARECVCAQVSAVSTLRCRCKMLPPWRDPGCCTAFCLPLKQFFLLLFLSCQGHQDQQRRWIPLCPLGVLCQHHQHCYTPTPLLVSARQSLCALQPSPKSERCSSGALRHTPEIFFPPFSPCVSLTATLLLPVLPK